MKKTKLALIAVAFTLMVGGGWFAMTLSNSHDDHGKMNHGAMSGGIPANATPSTRAYIKANDVMHSGMAIEFTGNADVDFAKGMIPHHKGAIDMAQIVLKYGKDPKTRALAKEIIAAQESEIAFLRGWLAEREK